ncbi:6941_t:CDS:2, partial [Racocetra persica]
QSINQSTMKHFVLTFFHIFAKNSDNDSANLLLWKRHLKELESIAISDRVHRKKLGEPKTRYQRNQKNIKLASGSSRSKSFDVDSKSKRSKDGEKNSYKETKRRKIDDENVEIPSPRAVTPLPPQTPEYQMFSSSSLTTRWENDEETDSDETDTDGIDTDKRDPKNLTFDEYVDGDGGRIDGDYEETPDYNDDEANVEAERDKQGSREQMEATFWKVRRRYPL